MYALTDGQGNYVCKDIYELNGSHHETYGITTDSHKAVTWKSSDTAENIRKNCLKSVMRKRFHTVEVIVSSEKETNIYDEIGESAATFEIEYQVNEETYDQDLSLIMESISSFDTLLNNSNTKLNILYHALSVADREITDIHHWIEFNNFNACEGYKAFALLKEKLKTRREIKNGIEIYQAVSGIEDAMLKVKNKKYKPRELKELFGG